MEYIAHREEDRVQLLLQHLLGTAERARDFAEKFGKGEWGYCCGMLHDIGKYSDKFQRKIKEDNSISVDHATAGARLCLEQQGMYSLLEYCIAGHHAGLPDYGNELDTGSASTLAGRRKKRIEDYQAYKTEVQIPALTTLPFNPTETGNPDFSLSFFMRMLYSCLVDADFLDTEDFMKAGKTQREAGENLTTLLHKLEKHVEDWLKNKETESVNGRRTEILRNCMEQGNNPKGLFRLTVPTGGGKTTASLGFALKHGVYNHMDRIIYVIPYTSIIEQNAGVFREILGDQNVLENHYNVDYDSSEEFKPMQLAAENWDKPVVVTTNVQFFESLYANKSSKCRKLHNMANSVIIFDEAQMLPVDYLKPCIAAMEELIDCYGSSVVLCTATQPALQSLFQKERNAIELCPRREEQFRFFERVRYKNLGYLREEELVSRLEGGFQTLCIVNTRKKAQKLYQKLKGEGCYHLSTSMYPKHRKRVLEQIRTRLDKKNPEKCTVIATSLVEAGVDLDFRTVYRQLAGIDSMIQAAGRCNREGEYDVSESNVFIFQFDEKETVSGQRQQIDVAKSLIAEKIEISDLGTIKAYFERLYYLRGEDLDKKKILQNFEKGKYNFKETAQNFKLIEEDTAALFIGNTEEAKKILQEIKFQGFTRKNMRQAGKFCINVRKNEMEKFYAAGIVRGVSEDVKDFYELTDPERYTEEMGLDLSVELGTALFV